MRKLAAVVVAGLFGLSTATVFAASHAGAKMDDKDKKADVKTIPSLPKTSRPRRSPSRRNSSAIDAGCEKGRGFPCPSHARLGPFRSVPLRSGGASLGRRLPGPSTASAETETSSRCHSHVTARAPPHRVRPRGSSLRHRPVRRCSSCRPPRGLRYP